MDLIKHNQAVFESVFVHPKLTTAPNYCLQICMPIIFQKGCLQKPFALTFSLFRYISKSVHPAPTKTSRHPATYQYARSVPTRTTSALLEAQTSRNVDAVTAIRDKDATIAQVMVKVKVSRGHDDVAH